MQEDARRYQPSLDAEVEERRRFAEQQLKALAMSNEAEIQEVKARHKALRDFFLPAWYSPLASNFILVCRSTASLELVKTCGDQLSSNCFTVAPHNARSSAFVSRNR